MKFDDLVKEVYDRKLEMADNRRVAFSVLEAKFQAPLSKFNFPPKAYLRLESSCDVFSPIRMWMCWLV